jgi:hypothetical protein
VRGKFAASSRQLRGNCAASAAKSRPKCGQQNFKSQPKKVHHCASKVLQKCCKSAAKARQVHTHVLDLGHGKTGCPSTENSYKKKQSRRCEMVESIEK